MEAILIGLIPAFLWGIQPVVMQILGGKPGNQLMGMVMGTLLLAIIVAVFRPPVEWTTSLIVASFVCGVVWSVAQFGQVSSFPLIGVSRAFPISTGLQLLGTSLVGIFYFHEWNTTTKLVLGLSAIVIIIIGVMLTAYQEKQGNETRHHVDMKKGIFILIISSAFFIIWVSIPRIANLNGWDVVLPQAIGAFLGTFFICLTRKDVKIWAVSSFKNIATGFVFFVANLAMMISNQMNGIAVGFTLTQMCVIVAGIGGILILKERKTRKELIYLLTGLFLVAFGGVLIGITKL
ncbi:glucose transporter GlcU [Brenneria izadpanahii]|uniref:Glucose transporter GlcU n=1 Tax=Brenneria izadpanahii TaxID=2722756 RepID=A0ABX7UXF1_9GAMM|nr:GRP family sugar transporter [Brenneria izadpanahii]QTF09007.1 glucose transporter GlcU [Brenneria izadpanahii]